MAEAPSNRPASAVFAKMFTIFPTLIYNGWLIREFARSLPPCPPPLVDRTMIKTTWPLLGISLLLSLLAPRLAKSDEWDFNRDIRPILSGKCISCHGPDEEHRGGGLRLDRESSAKEPREGVAAIVAGNLDSSELISRITATDPDFRMPPAEAGKELKPEEIEKLKQWIAAGARWSEHWAYQRPERHADPAVENEGWCDSWIDPFVLSKLERAGIQPADDADRVTLLRRLCFDLTGLPPTATQTTAFLQDTSPDALSRLVEELLASPRHGERMAMYWLDLVRYADTVGYHGDQDHNISPYRDWVIAAFNENLPFDQFTRAQLAGDLLPDANVDTLIASGYNRLLQTTHEGGLQPKEYLAIYAADRVRNVSAVWMGATMGCAQCHTHKYDPYTLRDFYSMVAFFADLDEAQHFKVGGNSLPTNRPPEVFVLTKQEREAYRNLTGQLETLRQELDRVLAGTAPYREQLDKEIADIQKQLGELAGKRRKTMVSSAIAPREIRILPRGNWQDDSGEVVLPAIPEFLGALTPGQTRATRLDLARWLVDAEHGAGLLTARVMVNRLWSLMFGRGLADLSDFGGQGSPPTHPELLDRLALEFVESGWDIKHMLRSLALTHAYRLSSVPTPAQLQRDPDNHLWGRQNRFRLPAEMVRDNSLAISGLLVESHGGPSARPYQPAGYYRHLNFPTREYVADGDQSQWRRGVYVHWQRQFLHPMLKAFDAPSREECTAERPRSNTPLAALALLNDPSFVEAARGFAQRILASEETADEARLKFAFHETLSRQPEELESRVLAKTLAEQRAFYASQPQAAEELLSIGLLKLPENVDRVELASWTQVARVLLNLNETITRN